MLDQSAKAARTPVTSRLRRHRNFRLQLLTFPLHLFAGAMLAAFVPLLMHWDTLHDASLTTTDVNSAISSAGAFVLGLLFLKNLSRHPEVSETSFTTISYLGMYALIFGLIALLHLQYSPMHLALGLLISIVWSHGIFWLTSRKGNARFAVIPVGNTDSVMAARSVDWTKLTNSNDVPDDVDGIVADFRADLASGWDDLLQRCAFAQLPLYDVNQVDELLCGRVHAGELSDIHLCLQHPSPLYESFKRTADVLAALLVLPILLPLSLVIMAVIRLESPGGAIFRQERVGYRGERFVLYKFRTMRLNDTGTKFTTRNDPRITRVGRVLRKYRIDELPQVINILRGEMSWIGPRPEATDLSDWYGRAIPFYGYRYMVRPGITGWAQVKQGYAAEIEGATEKLQYDFYYIKHMSPSLDFLILLLSVSVVARGLEFK